MVTKKKDMEQETTLKTVGALVQEGRRYRQEFENDWEEIQQQINIDPPAEWADKEDWQTKIYVPESSKIADTAVAMLNSMIFPRGKWYGLIGVEREDRKWVEMLTRFFDVLLDMGKFSLHNGFVMKEGGELGTSFLKVTVDPEPDPEKWHGFRFEWVSAIKAGYDPNAIVDFLDARYWFQEERVDIADILASDLYTKEGKDALLIHQQNKTDEKRADEEVRNIYKSEGNIDYKISREYQTVNIVDMWGFLPVQREKVIDGKKVSYTGHEWQVVTIAGDAIELRRDKDEYGFIPAVKCRVKRRANHGNGYGFVWNIRGLQDLMNSMVNHGFDSAKINMPICKIEESAVADPDSIEVRPLAKWILNDGAIDRARIENLPTQNSTLIVNDIAIIDQFIQEASGVSKVSQGFNPVFGKEETLGQTQLKNQSVQQRFFKIAEEVTEDYVVPVLRLMFKIMTHEQFVDRFQELFDRTMGVDIKQEAIQDPLTGQVIPIEVPVPKLSLRDVGQLALDFKAIGVINFVEKNEVLQKLTRILTMMLEAPQLQTIGNMAVVFQRIIELADIPDSKDLLKGEDEREAFMQQIMGNLGGLSDVGQTQSELALQGAIQPPPI